MQLFVTEYTKKGNSVVITDIDLLSQVRKVLRASIGDIIRVQNPHHENHKIRYEVRIDAWDNKTLTGSVISEQHYDVSVEKKSMIISMPNKWDKIELIVQKLTECSLDQIVFWPSERSIIKEWNIKKEERLRKIIKEAVEQSRWRTIPDLVFAPHIKEHLHDKEIIVFDKSEQGKYTSKNEKTPLFKKSDSKVWIIWPEGWLTYRDYENFAETVYDVYGLGETVLRTETAAIIWWRLLKNNFKF